MKSGLFSIFVITVAINNSLAMDDTKSNSIVYLEPVENIVDYIKYFQLHSPILRTKRDIHRPLFDYRVQQQRLEANRRRRQSRQQKSLQKRVRYFAIA